MGRYGEPCERFKWNEFEGALVNTMQEITLRGLIGAKTFKKLIAVAEPKQTAATD